MGVQFYLCRFTAMLLLITLDNTNACTHIAKNTFLKTFNSFYNSMFSCNKCSKTFSRRDNLLQHGKTVHGSKKELYKCSICSGKSFSRRPNLKKHYKQDHPELETSVIQSMVESAKSTQEEKIRHGHPVCKQCQKSFATERTLKIHLAAYHKVRYID